MKNIAIFASGNGTNAERVIRYFEKSKIARVNIVITNNNKAGVIKRAHSLKVDLHLINRIDFYNSDDVLDILTQYKVDLIVLAGFLWLVPETIINKYDNKIINIHPALLPSYGGKGMYGKHV
ncbi:MAG TPA: formyltransferase family protein, partial [Bacteroidales bacterium]|nr:formyltransferase family protein [Bacteroidales bacterium]